MPDDGLGGVPPSTGGSSGGSTVPDDVYQRYMSGAATDADLRELLRANEITPAQAMSYAANRVPSDWTFRGAGGVEPSPNIYNEGLVTNSQGSPLPYDINAYEGGGTAGGGSGYELRSINGDLYRINPDTGRYELLIPGGGGGSSSFDTGPGYLSLANQKFLSDEEQRRIENAQWQQQFGLSQTTADRGELANRAGAGQNILDFQRNLANDQYQRSIDPGNFPALLAAYAGREGQAPDALSQLLGENFQIQPIAGSNPLADPRFNQTVDDLYGYAHGVSANPDAVRAAYAKDPAAADLFFSQKPEDLARMFPTVKAAQGTDFITQRPTNILAGEAGQPERVTVTPLRSYTPGLKWTGSGQDLLMGATAPTQAPAAAAPSTSALTPAQGTEVALSKGLQPFSSRYSPELLSTYASGRSPGAAILNPQELARLQQNNPSLYRMALAAIKARLGSAGLEDFLAESARYGMRGFGDATGGVLY